MIDKNKINIVIADDHPIMLKGIKDELEDAGYTVSGTAENGAKALELIVREKPHIALIDIEMPLLSGYEVIKRSAEQSNKTKFIVMTYHKENGFIIQAKKCGAHGYLLKEDDIKEVEKCIEAALYDEFYYGKSLNENIDEIISLEMKKLKRLTPSERTVLRLIYKGNSSQQIAHQLSISIRTIEKHRSNIIQKLELVKSIDAISQWIKSHKELIEML
ncbi:response regulator [Winogradskyella sp.]|uniref:response regulator n=1 Tax=Winogradskyella sp. TaxID=1883156 RepID=UPI003512AB91